MYNEDKAQAEKLPNIINMCSLSLFLSQSFTNIDIPEWQTSLCFVNEIAIRLLDIFKGRAGHIGRLSLPEAELFSSCPLKGYREGMIAEPNHMINDINNHAYTMQLI